MKKKNTGKCVLRKVLVISAILLMLSTIVLPQQFGVLSETTTVKMDLDSGWNLKVMPVSISASDLALKSTFITNIVYRTIQGHYISFIPSIKATDFMCEADELIYIYSLKSTSVIFHINMPSGAAKKDIVVPGDLYVPGDTVLDKNLTVNGSMFVSGDMEINRLFVADYLISEGNLIVKGELEVGSDLTVHDNLSVENDLTVIGNIFVEEELTVKGNINAAKDLTVNGDLQVGKDLTIDNDLTVGKNLTVGNITLLDDMTSHGNLTVMKNLIVNESVTVGKNLYVSENTVIGKHLTVNENVHVGRNLTVDAYLTVNNDLNSEGNLTVGESLTVTGDVEVGRNLDVDDYLTVGMDLAVNGDLIVGKDLVVGNLTITDDLNYGGNLTVAEDLLVSGDILVSGYLDIGGDTTVGGDLSVAGDLIGATGRTVPFVVAANNAPQALKDQADFVCDGTNDEVEIQSALDLCSYGVGRVYLTEGTFNIAGTLNIPFGVTLEGSGMGISVAGTKLNWVGGFSDVIVYNMAGEPQGSQRRGNGIYRLTVDGNNACNAGIRVRNSFHHEIKQVAVRNTGGKGIIIEASFGEDITGCIITGCGDDGIFLTDYGGGPCTFIKIEGCEIGTNTNYNIRILSGERVTITKCWLENSEGIPSTAKHLYVNDSSVFQVQVRATECGFNNLRDGTSSIELDGGSLFLNHNSIFAGDTNKKGVIMTGGYLQMEGNEINIQNNGGLGRGVEITGSKYALIKGNSFMGDVLSDYAIFVQGVSVFNVDIDGNLFTGGGIYISQVGVTVKNNRFDDIATPYAIYANGNFILIENNHLYDLARTGIYLGGPYCEIIGNMIGQSGKAADNTYDALHIDGSYCIVDNNMIFSNNANKPRYGIFVEDEYYTSITNNFVEGTTTWDIYLLNGVNNLVDGNICPDGKLSLPGSPGDIYRNNMGYTTENSGNATVTNGAWITHGLVSIPGIVILTPRSGVDVWVIARNQNQFQVGVSSGTVTVDWYVKV